jgi:ArsR family transcriptional regulator
LQANERTIDQSKLIDQVLLIWSAGSAGRALNLPLMGGIPACSLERSRVPLPALVAAEPLEQQQARQLLKALADPLRLDLVQALSGGERCVCDLVADLNLAQSRLSFHLKVMREAGLIEAREEGRWVYYRLRAGALEQLQAWLGELAAGCQAPARCCS